MRPSPMRAEYHRWHSARPASNTARPTSTSARRTIRPLSLVAGGVLPMPWAMIRLPIRDGATATSASMMTSPMKTIRSRLYGAANRAMRRRVPGASFLSTTAGSREKDRIICMGPPWPGPTVMPRPLPPRRGPRRSERVDPGQGSSDDELLDLAGPLVQSRNPRVAQVLPGGVLVDVAVAAVRLDAVVGRHHGSFGREQLRLARRERVVLRPSLQIGDPPRHEAGCVERDGGVRDELLDELVGSDLLAELLALRR